MVSPASALEAVREREDRPIGVSPLTVVLTTFSQLLAEELTSSPPSSSSSSITAVVGAAWGAVSVVLETGRGLVLDYFILWTE